MEVTDLISIEWSAYTFRSQMLIKSNESESIYSHLLNSKLS